MATLAEIKKTIRRALEDRLRETLINGGVVMKDDPGVAAVAWPGLGFDRTAVTRYVRSGITFSYARVYTVGKNARIEAGGFGNFDSYTLAREGQDANDDLCAVVGSGFPYDLALVRNGVQVIIGAVDSRDPNPDGQWLQGPVLVPWTVYRI